MVRLVSRYGKNQSSCFAGYSRPRSLDRAARDREFSLSRVTAARREHRTRKEETSRATITGSPRERRRAAVKGFAALAVHPRGPSHSISFLVSIFLVVYPLVFRSPFERLCGRSRSTLARADDRQSTFLPARNQKSLPSLDLVRPRITGNTG